MILSSSLAAPGERPLHLLMIDDCEQDLELIREALAILDPRVQVTTARSWSAVPEAVWASRLDVILVDLHMPGSDGVVVLQQLRADPGLRQTPVIIRSGSDAPGDIARAYAAGASAYVLKPSDFDGLVAQLHALLAFWQLNRTLSGFGLPR